MDGRMDGYELGPFQPRWTSRGRRPVHGAGPDAPTPRRPCPLRRPCAVRAMRLRPAPAWGARAVAEVHPRRRSGAPPHTRARQPVEACLTQPRATAECVRAAPCARAGRAPRGGGAVWCRLDHMKGAAPWQRRCATNPETHANTAPTWQHNKRRWPPAFHMHAGIRNTLFHSVGW